MVVDFVITGGTVGTRYSDEARASVIYKPLGFYLFFSQAQARHVGQTVVQVGQILYKCWGGGKSCIFLKLLFTYFGKCLQVGVRLLLDFLFLKSLCQIDRERIENFPPFQVV